MVGSNEGRGEENSIVVRIRVDFLEVGKSAIHLLIFGAGQEEHVSLHPSDIDPGSNLDVGVSLFHSEEVLLAVVFAGVEGHLLEGLVLLLVDGSVLPEIIVAGDEVVELFHVFNRQLDAFSSPESVIRYHGAMNSSDYPLKCLTSSLPNCSEW